MKTGATSYQNANDLVASTFESVSNVSTERVNNPALPEKKITTTRRLNLNHHFTPKIAECGKD